MTRHSRAVAARGWQQRVAGAAALDGHCSSGSVRLCAAALSAGTQLHWDERSCVQLTGCAHGPADAHGQTHGIVGAQVASRDVNNVIYIYFV